MAKSKAVQLLDQAAATKLTATLDAIYDEMALRHAAEKPRPDEGSERLRGALSAISAACSKASSAFTNVFTCLAVKTLFPELDIRKHQVQIGAPFSFRRVSEDYIYPWLQKHKFEGAKSGWQTRTFERPKPYTMDYDEHIGAIKVPFLTIFDEIQENSQDAAAALAYLIYDQIVLREKKKLSLICPSTTDILLIEGFFRAHFFQEYKSKGASRLPVLALHAIYQVMMEQVQRYNGMRLRDLQSHSAADSQTGAIGDIEVERQNGGLFEGIEVKHDIVITEKEVEAACEKFADTNPPPDRYYILTTHNECQPSTAMKALLQEKKNHIGTQIIINGVLPTIRYYLRLLSNPSAIFSEYTQLLEKDPAISFEHREAWNPIVIGKKS
jgi:DNA (cytosine-5)-methyltransferase 1